MIVHGGRIWTGDEANPAAEAFFVEGGVFRAVGGLNDVEARARASCGHKIDVIDAGGALVMPGISDAHIHLTAYCKNQLYTDLSAVSSIDELLGALKSHIEEHPEFHWVRAFGYNETLWPKPIQPTMDMIDSIANGRAVIVSRYCGHAHVAGRIAMEESGLWNSRDANVVRGPDGLPTGVLNEEAPGPILSLVEREHETRERIKSLAVKGCGMLASMGVTAVHACDAPLYGLPEDISIFQDMRDSGDLPIRVITYADRLPGMSFRSGLGDRFVQYAGLKIFLDGSLGARTAALRADFSDAPGNKGQLNHSDEELFDLMYAAFSRDIQVQIHMIGDAATDQAIRVAKRVYERLGGRPRRPPRFNHVIVSPPEQLDDLVSLGVVIDIQPIQTYTDRFMAPSRLGPERMRQTYQFRRFYDSGLIMTGSSDAPMENPNPWRGIWVAVCRTDSDGVPFKYSREDQALALDEALTIYTRNPYRAIGWDGYGVIAEGASADFAILGNNPFEDDAQKLKDVKVRATYLEGVKTYGG
jgi:predicted amidohydrolase YtcJ